MKIKGYTVFLVKCADGSYFSGICRDMDRKLKEINEKRKGYYFHSHPERLPVQVVFKEGGIIFKEAYTKHIYLRSLTRRSREKMIRTGAWPLGRTLRKFVEKLDL